MAPAAMAVISALANKKQQNTAQSNNEMNRLNWDNLDDNQRFQIGTADELGNNRFARGV